LNDDDDDDDDDDEMFLAIYGGWPSENFDKLEG
jgi:hypothetical protein